MIRISRQRLVLAFALSIGAGCASGECGAPRAADAVADSGLAVDAAPEAAADAGASDAATAGACADAAVQVAVELVVRPHVENAMHADDWIDGYDPMVSLHVSQLPGVPSGSYVVVAARPPDHEGDRVEQFAHGYARGTAIVYGANGQLWTMRGHDLELGGGTPLHFGMHENVVLTIAPDGRVVRNRRTVGTAKVATFGAPSDAGTWLAKTDLDPTAVTEELVTERTDGGVLRAERWRTLFRVTDIDPLDGCQARVADGSAYFECERGGHPSARAHVTNGTLLVEVTHAGVSRTVESMPLPAGACVELAASYRQDVVPGYDPMAPDTHRLDPLARALEAANAKRVQTPGRCAGAAASSKPPIEVQILMPRRGSTDEASVFVPALHARRSLGVFPANEYAGCEARAYPRSSIAIVRCYDAYDNGTTQTVLTFDEGELSTGEPPDQDPDSGNIIFPCNARIRYVIRKR